MSTLAALRPVALVHKPAPRCVRTLADARPGERLEVRLVRTPGALGERLMELGLVPGTEVDLLRRGWFGGHLHLGVRGAILPLHLAQARDIDVRVLSR